MDYLATAWCATWIKSIIVRCRYYMTRDTLAEALKPQLQVRVTQQAQLVVILQLLITLAKRKPIPRVAFFPNQTQLRNK